MIRKYGRVCIVTPTDGSTQTRVHAMINPLLYKNKMYLNDVFLPDGYCDRGSYLYIGDPNVRLDDLPFGTVLNCGGVDYTIMRSEQYFIDEHPIYTWAILQICKRGESDD